MQNEGISDKKRKTTSIKFDPFRDRLSRDIRNSLSEAFVTSLRKKDRLIYQQLYDDWMSKDLASIYVAYIRDRGRRYEYVFDQVQRYHLNDELLRVLIIWNCGLFFEVHDQLEHIWHQSSGDRHEALKGLIKAAGVYIHLEYHHLEAAQRLARKSSGSIRKYSHCLTFITNLNVLLEKLDNLDPLPPVLKNPAFEGR